MRPYYHVDVFATGPLSGNGLTVFPDCEGLSDTGMLLLTREMQQFESIFLSDHKGRSVRARIYTVEEELDFAGHPLLGAATVLHQLHSDDPKKSDWTFLLNAKTVKVSVEALDLGYFATMNQGHAEFGESLDDAETEWLLDTIGLSLGDLYGDLRPTVVSTGLPYLIIPLRKNGNQASLDIRRFEDRVLGYGAKFIGILEIPTLTIRTGDTAGQVEDIATGSLAGPSAAFLVKNGLQEGNIQFTFTQGENLGRPSKLSVNVTVEDGILGNIFVSGKVFKMSKGFLDPSLGDLLK